MSLVRGAGNSPSIETIRRSIPAGQRQRVAAVGSAIAVIDIQGPGQTQGALKVSFGDAEAPINVGDSLDMRPASFDGFWVINDGPDLIEVALVVSTGEYIQRIISGSVEVSSGPNDPLYVEQVNASVSTPDTRVANLSGRLQGEPSGPAGTDGGVLDAYRDFALTPTIIGSSIDGTSDWIWSGFEVASMQVGTNSNDGGVFDPFTSQDKWEAGGIVVDELWVEVFITEADFTTKPSIRVMRADTMSTHFWPGPAGDGLVLPSQQYQGAYSFSGRIGPGNFNAFKRRPYNEYRFWGSDPSDIIPTPSDWRDGAIPVERLFYDGVEQHIDPFRRNMGTFGVPCDAASTVIKYDLGAGVRLPCGTSGTSTGNTPSLRFLRQAQVVTAGVLPTVYEMKIYLRAHSARAMAAGIPPELP